jgi:hypothetical protein
LSQRLRALDYSALLALIGTVSAGLLTAGFLPDILFNPVVFVEIKNSNIATPEMLITNDGSRPANNVHLYVETSKKILTVTNIFSTTGVSMVRPTPLTLEKGKPIAVDSNSLEIFIPHLIHGLGSTVVLKTLLESKSDSYEVNILYDEGSGIGDTLPSFTRSIGSFYSSFLILLIPLLGIEVGVFIAITIFRAISRRRKRRLIIKTLLRNIGKNRRKIVKDNHTTEELDNIYHYVERPWWKDRYQGTFMRQYFQRMKPDKSDDLLDKKERMKLWNSRHSELQNLMKNPRDYAIIDDLYAKISERNEKMKENHLPNYDKKEINTQCFNLMEKALNIEWHNYV